MNIDAHKQRCLDYLLWLIFFLNLGLFLSLQTKRDFFQDIFLTCWINVSSRDGRELIKVFAWFHILHLIILLFV